MTNSYEGVLTYRTQYGHVRMFIFDSCMEIADMWVSESFRRRGEGSRLLAVCISIGKLLNLEKITLHVDTTNTAAVELYHAYGFEPAAKDHHMELEL